MADHPVDIRAFGLLPQEYELILELLGRQPNLVELGMLGAMWSEHCGYKHSRKLLKHLPTSGTRVLQGPGENAGAVDIGDGLAVVLKMESHNHPSAVEPFQGAATGVGGILRDIFTMGARPVAILNSLRFGALDDPRTHYLMAGVIGGIGHYGNCFGTPTVGGEISFLEGYEGNPIVNAMCVGIAPVDGIMRARASGPGNALLLVGADTGRDGLQGAAFASNEDPEASHRGVVQVGNPFLEKLLLEACLATLGSGDVLAMQDLGAAGLTSSAVEMAARGGLGVDIDVARVPRRETGLTPFEVMLSESQERMLLLVRAGSEAAVQAHFARWELHAVAIGTVTAEQTIRIRDGAEVVAKLPTALLTDDVPAYDLTPQAPPLPIHHGAPPIAGAAAARGALSEVLLRLLASPNLRSRRFAFRQYDSTVQGNTVLGPGHAAAVIRVEGSTKGLAMTTDCNPRYMQLDPRRGAMQAVAEAARNLACVGAEPIAVTDCLNFGNPEKPLVAWQLTEAIAGLAEACRRLDVPIVSGNVSLYNEAAGRAIPPTPTVGMVGLLSDVSLTVPTGFARDCAVILLGEAPTDLCASEYLPADVRFPRFDLDAERKLHGLLRELASRRLVRSAQDVADGGLAAALAECAMLGGSGAILRVDGSLEVALFSEDQGRAVISCAPGDVDAVVAVASEHAVPAIQLGETGGDRLKVDGAFDLEVAALRAAWEPET
ncbi:MAG: phosphoribosylformylglycinamidine synthase subunit PurL [Chloroflexi bacterium]|nr:phosphoribosylformylglycinamidine synthase subunit PurL [Chloroflexota bacterium]